MNEDKKEKKIIAMFPYYEYYGFPDHTVFCLLYMKNSFIFTELSAQNTIKVPHSVSIKNKVIILA